MADGKKDRSIPEPRGSHWQAPLQRPCTCTRHCNNQTERRLLNQLLSILTSTKKGSTGRLYHYSPYTNQKQYSIRCGQSGEQIIGRLKSYGVQQEYIINC